MSAARMDGRVALVAGGIDAASREAAVELASLGAAVVLVAPDGARGEAAVADVRRRSGNPAVQLIAADLSSLDGVRRAAERFGAMHARLDVLVNGAAGRFAERTETVDGFEATLAAAHLAPALLTHLLLPRLRASVPARIVNAGGGVPRRARLRWDDLQSTGGYRAHDAYARARLLNLTWTYELARRLRGTGITVVAADPGTAATRSWPLLGGWRRGRSPGEAARSIVVAATSRELVSGAWLDARGVPARSSRASHDGEAALRAWETTAELLGIPLDQFAATRVHRRRTPQEPAPRNRMRSGWADEAHHAGACAAAKATAA